MAGLGKYSIHNWRWFNFQLHTDNPDIIKAAEDLLTEIGGYTGTKDRMKTDFMVKLLLNLKVSFRTNDMIGIMRTPEYYAAIPERYRHETQSYEISKRIIDLLINHHYIYFKRGMINKDKHKIGVPSKMRPLDKLLPILNRFTEDDLIIQPPKDLIILRDADENDTVYLDTTETNKWRAELISYNDFLKKNTVSLYGLSREIIKENISYFRNYDLIDTMNIDTIDESKFARINLKNLQVRRIFNIDFNHGGRFYGGVELMPSVVRPFIQINESPTVELDFSAYQIRMLYHKLRKDYEEDAYTAMCDTDDPDERTIYKLASLIVINSANEETALKGLRKSLSDENLMPFTKKTDAVLKPFLDKFTSHHSSISKFFYKGVGLELQALESKITNNILLYFAKKKILVLSVHDSYIIAAEHREELLKIMKLEYRRIFKKDPVIK